MKPIMNVAGRDVWRLVHTDGVSVKKAASRLRIPMSRAFELLAEERSRREALTLREVVSEAMTPTRYGSTLRR
jgi:hypothetical protein